MSSFKIGFYAITALIVGGIGYWLYSHYASLHSNSANIDFNICIISNNPNVSKFQEYLKSKIDDKTESITLKIKDKTIKIGKKTGIGAETSTDFFIQNVLDSLKKSLSSVAFKNSLEDAKAQLYNFGEELVNANKGVQSNFILLGSFPNEFSKNSSDSSIKTLKDYFSRIDNNAKIEIVLSFETNPNNPEKSIIDAIIKLNNGANISVKDLNINTPLKNQSSALTPLKQVNALVLSPIKGNDLNELCDFIATQFGENISLKLITDDNNNGKSIILKNRNFFVDSLKNIIPNVAKVKYSALGFLLKQVVNQNLASKDIVKKVFIVGNFPKEEKGDLIDNSFWDSLKNNQNIEFVFYFPKTNPLQYFDKAIPASIKKLKIKVMANK